MKKQPAKKHKPATKDDPFAGCILAEKSRRGERPQYYYTPLGIPKLRAKSVPGWSPFFHEEFKVALRKSLKEAAAAKAAQK